MTSRLLPLAVPIAAVALLAGVAGCGSSDSDDTASDTSASPSASASSSGSSGASASSSPSPSASHPDLPACKAVWIEGKRLPKPYKGCVENGKKDDSYTYYCSIGNRLVTYGAAYYAVPGAKINKAHPTRAKDPEWARARDTCTG